MAIIYGKDTAKDYASGNLASFGKSYSRMGAAPLDMYEVWYDWDALVAYASYRGNDKDGNPVYDAETEVTDTSAVVSYVGQKVAYVDDEAGKIYHYSIQLDGTLKEIGVVPVGDNASISVNEDGLVALYGFAGATEGCLPIKEGGKVVWKTVAEVAPIPEGDGKSITVDASTKKISLKGFDQLTAAQVGYLPRVKKVVDVAGTEIFTPKEAVESFVFKPVKSNNYARLAHNPIEPIRYQFAAYSQSMEAYTALIPGSDYRVTNNGRDVDLKYTSIENLDNARLTVTYKYNERSYINEQYHLEIEWAPVSSVVKGDGNTVSVVEGMNGIVVTPIYNDTTDTYTYKVEAKDITDRLDILEGNKDVEGSVDNKIQKLVAALDEGEYDGVRLEVAYADIANQAMEDLEGNVITETYATKEALQVLVGDLINGEDSNGERFAVGLADHADSATKATQDGNGKVIANTYETKGDANTKLAQAKEYTEQELLAFKDQLTDDSLDENLTVLKAKADKDGNEITATYETKGDASDKLQEAKKYADDQIDDLVGQLENGDIMVDHAGQADCDGEGNTITATYAKKAELVDYSVTITEDTTDSAIAKRYIFTQLGAEIGRIDLAKELVVSGGSVGEVVEDGKPYEGAKVGDKYIELVIANQTTPIYVPAKDLVDIYTAKKNATEVQVDISNTNEISATLVDGGITEVKLHKDVAEKLNKVWEEVGVAEGLVDGLYKAGEGENPATGLVAEELERLEGRIVDLEEIDNATQAELDALYKVKEDGTAEGTIANAINAAKTEAINTAKTEAINAVNNEGYAKQTAVDTLYKVVNNEASGLIADAITEAIAEATAAATAAAGENTTEAIEGLYKVNEGVAEGIVAEAIEAAIEQAGENATEAIEELYKVNEDGEAEGTIVEAIEAAKTAVLDAVNDEHYAKETDLQALYKVENGQASGLIVEAIEGLYKVTDGEASGLVATELDKKIENGTIAHTDDTLVEGITKEDTTLKIVVDAYKKSETYNTTELDGKLYEGSYTNAEGQNVTSNITANKDKARLISTEEIKKLAGLSIAEDGSVGISGTVEAGNVTGLGTYIDGRVTGANGLNIAAGAQVNVIEAVKVDGTALKVENKAVNIVLPKKLSELQDDLAHVATIKVKDTQKDGDTIVYASKLKVERAAESNTVTIDDSALQDAINAVNANTIHSVSVNNTPVAADTQGHVTITVATGSQNGTLAVAGTDIAVKGLGTAAYHAEGDFKTVQQAVTDPTATTSTATTLTFVDSIAQDTNGVIIATKKSYDLKTNVIDKLNTLIGEDANKAARTIAAEEVAKIVGEAPEAFDTLKEIADWITDDNTGAAAVVEDIAKHEAQLAGIGGEEEPETVIEAINTAITNLPLATATTLGLVKSAADVDGKTATNKVYVDAEGVGEVKAVSTDILVQGNLTLILNAGDVAVTSI